MTDRPHAPPAHKAPIKAALSAWDALADTRRRLALRAWRDWPEDLPIEIAPPPAANDPD